ncbi:hypothetical protein WMY93_013476 [Mugilogobius chulae]|uniref:LIM domain only protein 7 n=1 Tax=Mugilogobius chulae TaxID=88201 RepID=A0AAW0NZL1_9GOBI
MEWRQQTSLSCADAFTEAQRWIEEVTGKSFDCSDFRAALENGVLLCDLINKIKPGIIKRVNRLSTPIAGLDNVSVFLKACGKLGLNESQLFHPGDLQDLSTRVTLKRDEGSRRLKNVLITIYWLGRKANQDLLYEGPQLNFKSFEGLLGLALSRGSDESSARGRATRDRVQWTVWTLRKSEQQPQTVKAVAKVKQAKAEKGCTSPMSRSKSLTDIPMVYPARNVPEEEKTNIDEAPDPGTIQFKRKNSATKDTEAQWHEDLNKWKSRRRSSKAEGLRTSQDREHVIHQMTNGSKTTYQKTVSQGGPMKRDQPSQHSHNPTSHPYSTTSPTKSSRANLRPHTRALLARSYATDMPYNSPPSYCPQTSGHIQGPTVGSMSEPMTNILDKDNYMAALASVGTAATTPSMENPFSSQTHVKDLPVMSREITKLNAAAEELTLANHAEVYAVNDPTKTIIQNEKYELKMDPINGQGFEKFISRSGTWSGSASLPRGYRRSEVSSRLSSVISARPFGTKPSRAPSLPRLCNVDDNQMNCLSNNKISPPVTSLKRQTATAHLKGHAPVMQTGLSAEQKNCASLSSEVQTSRFHPHPLVQVMPQSQLCTAHVPQLSCSKLVMETNALANVDHSDMRVCLTLKPNSRQDFGFQTHWDSTGARVKSIQPGSPAELCHLCINDEIIAIDGVSVTQLNFNQWKNKMTSALQTGTLNMDIRRYGNRGGSESAISDLQVPSLSPSSGNWSWDRDEERRRQEKWQEEQERLLQEKYQRDQERLEAEWKKHSKMLQVTRKRNLKWLTVTIINRECA